jgi:hypothetical protein
MFARHHHAEDIVSESWGSYFYSTDPRVVKKKSNVMGRASSFKKMSTSGNSPDLTGAAGCRAPSAQSKEALKEQEDVKR